MAVVPVFHPDPNIRATLRRGLRHARMRVVSCRTIGLIDRVMQEDLVNAIVVDVRRGAMDEVFEAGRPLSRGAVVRLQRFSA